MNHLKVQVIGGSAGFFYAQCECGMVLIRQHNALVTDIDQAIAAHRLKVSESMRHEKLNYVGPERRQARPILEFGGALISVSVPEQPVTCQTCGDTGEVHYRTGVDEYESDRCPDCAPPLPPEPESEPEPVLPAEPEGWPVRTELEVRLARLERIVHRLVTNPTTRQASMDEIRDAWREEGEQLRDKPVIGCRCEGPEHDPDCWKKYS